ncbi:unnamed protein product [Gongylonema pulchrum]|uniref:Secreted protein n=1 Tax=Gongylonema pulchrum TaxID=637853 RepID=A0A183DGJ1_9BILA|nr:unnamed protein product [Gongylonema pulchrum]
MNKQQVLVVAVLPMSLELVLASLDVVHKCCSSDRMTDCKSFRMGCSHIRVKIQERLVGRSSVLLAVAMAPVAIRTFEGNFRGRQVVLY